MESCKKLAIAVAFVVTSSIPAWSQANVNEGLETAVLYVDTVNGSDSNPGTATQPLKTIGAAVSIVSTNNINDIGTRVIINPGVYREAVTITTNQQMTSMPATYEAAVNGTVIVSGAQQWTGWQVYSGNRNIYTNTWPYAWGLCPPLAGAPPAPDIVYRREMLFIDGKNMTQVMALGEVVVGTFYVDETGGTIYVWPPAGTNMSKADVEVPVQSPVWQIQGVSNLIMRGLTFKYGNSCRDTAAVDAVSNPGVYDSNILFDSDYFYWNNAHGMQLGNTVSDFTVQNSVASHNGQSGMVVDFGLNGLYQNNEAGFNNWRGALGDYYNTDSAGFHFSGAHEFTMNNATSYWNQTYGSHFDTDNANVTINNFVASQNLLIGALIERDEGPVNIANSSYCSGYPAINSGTSGGIDIRDSTNVTVTGSNFVNTTWAIVVNGITGGYQITNWETGQIYTLFSEYATFMQNNFVGTTGQQLFSDTYNWDWIYYQPTLISDYNTWWNPTSSMNFVVPIGNDGAVNFASWQADTGQDTHSVWASPSGNISSACWQAPDMIDFWFLTSYTDTFITVNPGGSAVWPVNLVPLRFTGTAQLSYDVSSIPGATASYGANTLGPNQSTNLTVNTPTSTPAGNYLVVMTATSGSVTHTINVMLTVQ